MRAAIVHYWLLNMRGGEKVVEALCRLLPEADLFTLYCEPERISPELRKRRIYTSTLNRYRRFYRSLLPLAPMALEQFDLREYELVVSSESGPAKGVLAPSTARHVCYCHTPMRYLWDLYPEYRNEWVRSRWRQRLMAPLATWLRTWDYSTAARVDEFVANSENVRRRIRRAWGRESVVVHPPVAVESCYTKPSEGYYLAVAELVAYKRLDVAVEVCARSGRRLRIVGEGPEYRRLKRLVGGGVEFCGRVPDEELRELYAQCRALIMPGEEDFGITPVEALASGKPVVALRRGGAVESVPAVEPFGGVFFERPEAAGLAAALDELERREVEVEPEALRAFARRFSEEEFARKMRPILAAGAA